MIQSLFYADTAVIAAVSVAATMASAALAHAIVFRTKLFAPARGRPVVGPFFTGTAGLFALFLAFNASHAWTNDTAARNAAGAERAAAERILTVVSRFHPRPAEAALPVRAYLATVVDEEWGAGLNRAPSPAAIRALRAIEAMVWDARAQHRLDDALGDVLVRALDALEAARGVRLGLTADIGDGVRWCLLVVLGFTALLSMATCHADRPETARIAVGIFAVAISAVTAVSAMYESPYTGLFALGPERLAALLAEHGGPPR